MTVDATRAERLLASVLEQCGLTVDAPPTGDQWTVFTATLAAGLTAASLESAVTATERQRALAEIGRRAIEGAAVAEMLRSTVELAASAMQAVMATVFEVRDGSRLHLRADVNWGTYSADYSIPISPDSQAAYVFATPSGTVVVEDYESETRFTPAAILRARGIRSTIAARIGSAADPFGIISVHSDQVGHFGADDDVFISELAHVLTMVIDRERHADWLARKAFHDDLTGLANRALLRDRMEHALDRSRRSAAIVTLLLFDLDGFKLINDSRGHAAGDRLLVDVARRLEQNLRDGDTPARIGGDEFAVLLDDSKPEEALVLAERLLAVMREPFHTEDGDVFVRASIGVASNEHSALCADELMVRADLAMYAAKGGGRDRFQLFTPDMQAQLQERHRVQADLENAVANREFVLRYQPIMELATGRIASLEALVRWQHPTRGLVGPDDFIGIADDSNHIVGIGRFVLHEACRQLAEWRAEGAVGDAVSIAVNVAAKQLYDSDFCGEVEQALAVTRLPAVNLTVELTEGTLLADTAFMRHRLQRLRELGVRIAVDDFGTGYSSLAYLHAFPIDVLKIDKAFVHGLRLDGSDADVMIRSIVGLGHNLGLRVVAEGIEFAEQCMKVEDAGCDLGQGYLFAKPLSADDFRAYAAGQAAMMPDPAEQSAT